MLCFVCVLLCCFWFLIQVMQTFTCCAICLSCKWCVCLCVSVGFGFCVQYHAYILQGTCLSMLHVEDSVSKMAFPVFPYLCAPHCTLIKQCLPKKCNESMNLTLSHYAPSFLYLRPSHTPPSFYPRTLNLGIVMVSTVASRYPYSIHIVIAFLSSLVLSNHLLLSSVLLFLVNHILLNPLILPSLHLKQQLGRYSSAM